MYCILKEKGKKGIYIYIKTIYCNLKEKGHIVCIVF